MKNPGVWTNGKSSFVSSDVILRLNSSIGVWMKGKNLRVRLKEIW